MLVRSMASEHRTHLFEAFSAEMPESYDYCFNSMSIDEYFDRSEGEEPWDYKDNNFEHYSPVKTSDGRYRELYKVYRAKAERLDNMSFIGRCGTYQYLDMDQVINQSIMDCRKWIAEHLDGGPHQRRD
ncbi:hypothetical protein [Enterovirga sp.]|uniref:hypothetical protein n=1 Tax=Enterovirga sp. TaxID=2026350 RepID=UPI002BD2AAAE|nr:hypothetical protein [Enterovirga sp.]HMO30923.1 hypothetical protein [Enterovirga sp.]